MKIRILIIFTVFMASILSAINGYAIVGPGNNLTSFYVEGSLSITDPNMQQWEKATALEIPLSGQAVVAPMRFTPFTQSLQIKSLNNGSWIAFLITWTDPTENNRTVKIDEFRDAVAIQLSDSVQSFICMGVADQKVNILQWKADWQADIEQGFQDLQHAFPNFWVDVYPYAVGNPPYNVPEAFPEVARVYLPGWYVGNPFSDPLKVTPVEDAVAIGYGSITTQESQDAIGRGTWRESVWSVIISRKLDTGDANDVKIVDGAETALAFAVWNGADGDVGARKSVSSWAVLDVQTPSVQPLISLTTAVMLFIIITVDVVVAYVIYQRRKSSKL